MISSHCPAICPYPMLILVWQIIPRNVPDGRLPALMSPSLVGPPRTGSPQLPDRSPRRDAQYSPRGACLYRQLRPVNCPLLLVPHFRLIGIVMSSSTNPGLGRQRSSARAWCPWQFRSCLLPVFHGQGLGTQDLTETHMSLTVRPIISSHGSS